MKLQHASIATAFASLLIGLAGCDSGNSILTGVDPACPGIDVRVDPNNCGRCRNQCVMGVACTNGVCGGTVSNTANLNQVSPSTSSSSSTTSSTSSSGTTNDGLNGANISSSSSSGAPANNGGNDGSNGANGASSPSTSLQVATLPQDGTNPRKLVNAYYGPVGFQEGGMVSPKIADLATLPNGFVYKCRQSKLYDDLGNLTPPSGAFTDFCDLSSGTTKSVRLKNPAVQANGMYRIEVKAFNGTQEVTTTPATLTIDVYVHDSLNNVSGDNICNQNLSDAQIAAAVHGDHQDGTTSLGAGGGSAYGAVNLATQYDGTTAAQPFAGLAVHSVAPTQLVGPRIAIPLQNARISYAMWDSGRWNLPKVISGPNQSLDWFEVGTLAGASPSVQRTFVDHRDVIGTNVTIDSDLTDSGRLGAAGTPGSTTFGSLRHRFTVVSREPGGSTADLLIVRRDRKSAAHNNCENRFPRGNDYAFSLQTAYDEVYARAEGYDVCEALVLNAHGLGKCVSAAGTVTSVSKTAWTNLLSDRAFSAKCFDASCVPSSITPRTAGITYLPK